MFLFWIQGVRMSMNQLQFVTLQEMELVVALSKTKSIRELARRVQLPPSQISKNIKRLEQKIGSVLIHRSLHGVTFTKEGQRILPVVRRVLHAAEGLRRDVKDKERSTIGVGATSFLINHLLTKAFSSTEMLALDINFRFLELAPDQFAAAGLRNAFEVAFYFGKIEWPGTWFSMKVGEIPWEFCVRKNHPLTQLKKVRVKDIRPYRFVLPTYWTQEGLFEGDDSCPIPRTQRLVGSETSTAEAAIAIVRESPYIGFLPSILIKTYEDLGRVSTLNVESVAKVKRPLFMAARADAIKEKLFQDMANGAKACF